jgi:hypothetical protein
MRTLPLAASTLVLASIASVAAAQDDRYGPPPEADASGASGHADDRAQAYNGPFLSWAGKAGAAPDQAPPPAPPPPALSPPPPPVMSYAPRPQLMEQPSQSQSNDSVQIRADQTAAASDQGYTARSYTTQTTSRATERQAFASQTSDGRSTATSSTQTDAPPRQRASLTAPTHHVRHAAIVVKTSPPPPPALAQSRPADTSNAPPPTQTATNQATAQPQQTAQSQQPDSQPGDNAPTGPLAQGDGYQGPPTGVHFYSLHREYGLTPDPDPAPTDRPLVLIGPPTDQSAAQHDDTAGGAGADSDASDDDGDSDHSGKSGHAAATQGADD